MNRLTKFARLPHPDQRLFLEAALWLGIARLAIQFIPFRWIAPFLGTHMVESSRRIESSHRGHAERISWAIKTTSHHMPWECKCLAQAMVAKGMFKLRGIQSTIYLGLAKEGEEKLTAHAWLRTGEVTVVGTRGNDRFTVVSTFAEGKS